MFTPNPGELRTLSGVTKLNPTAMAGIGDIVHAKFLDTANEKDLVVFFKPTTTLPSAPSGFTFSGGSYGATGLFVEYITTGGGRIATKYTSSGTTVIIPAGIDTLVRSINYWAYDTDVGTPRDLLWLGASYRVNGLFPASITLPTVGNSASSTVSSLVYSYTPGIARFTPGYDAVNGQLQGGRQYYFGVAPHLPMAHGYYAGAAFNTADFDLVDTPTLLSFYLGEKYNKIDFVFEYLPYDVPDTNNVPINAAVVISKALVFLGITPEDMLPCSSVPGSSVPYSIAQASGSNIDTATGVDTGNDNITVSNSFPVGTLLKYKTSGGSITPLVNNSYYYVKEISAGTGGNYQIKLSNTPDGAIVDLTATGAGNVFFQWATVTGTVNNLPNSMEVIPSCGSQDTDKNVIVPTAISGRASGYVQINWDKYWTEFSSSTDPSTKATPPNKIGCAVFTDLTVSSRRDVLYPNEQRSFNLDNYSWLDNFSNLSNLFNDNYNITFKIPNALSYDSNGVPSSFIDWKFQSRQYGNRLWLANGFNEPFYTNGYVLKSIVASYAASYFKRPSITDYIEFYKNQMCLAGQKSNPSYQEGYVYPSLGNDIQDFSNGTSTLRAVPVNTGDQSSIFGLNVYSQDLSTVGAESFLVVGKQAVIYVWDGTIADAAKQISKATGFAGPDCYALTKFGPIFVGSDNVYLFRSSQDIVPIGDPVKDIIKSLSPDDLYNVVCQFHDEDIKIGYKIESALDNELWLRLMYNQGGVDRIWSGPHMMKPYNGVCSILTFNSENNVRISFVDNDLYRRDDPGSFLNDEQSINRSIKISNLGLQQDHLLKLINEIKMALRTNQDEDFEFTLESQDGSQSIVVSGSQDSSGNMRQMGQFQIPQRFLARVLSITIENSGNADLSIYDLSILFEVLRRRLIP